MNNTKMYTEYKPKALIVACSHGYKVEIYNEITGKTSTDLWQPMFDKYPDNSIKSARAQAATWIKIWHNARMLAVKEYREHNKYLR